ncbi:adenylate kinase 8 [Tribolium madens]|uniref:adenylate kinase 8 n=1 Tax=Tribolium madens TaxID=41895 RepID=UPI001CF729F4|nr:adenylate kinase 8 [Tribolium madens]
MVDATKRPLHLPPWQIPFLEKHRILELFHELARELVIQQPDDHVLFLKQILINAARNRDTARVIILCSPKVNCLEIANAIAEITKQNVITEHSLLTFSGRSEIRSPDLRAKYIGHFVRTDNAYENGWILVDCIKNENDAKALLKLGILPTHVIHLIPSFQPRLTELLYCHVSAEWPEYRRTILGLRNAFKHVLREVFFQQRSLSEIVTECIEILNIKPAKYAIKPRVLILGPRGSGRKTQAKLLVEGLGLIHVDFEHLICEAWMSDSDLGKRLRNCKNEVCFHSELLAEVVHKRVLEDDCLEHGWVLTGFPFSKRDFEFLDCIYTPPNRVIFLECDLSICKERLLNRKINVHTGSVTNIKQHPEAEVTKELKPHPKDNKEFIDAELSYYCENYGDLKKYCGASAHCVNGDQAERWIYETIIAIISRAPSPHNPRRPLVDVSSSSVSLDACCCSPIPSQILDCYNTKL